MEGPHEAHPSSINPPTHPPSYLALRSIVCGLVQVANRHESTNTKTRVNGSSRFPENVVGCETRRRSLLVDGLEQLQGRLDLSLGLAGLHRGANDGDVLALGRHVVSVRDHAHVDVWRGESTAVEHANVVAAVVEQAPPAPRPPELRLTWF